MAYSKHNFSDGSVLHASSLNEMDTQILANEAAAASAASAASAAASAAAGKYSKPQGGIPASDLAEDVLNGKQDLPAIVTTGTSITLVDNTVYKLTGVSTLTITFPGSGSYHSHIRLTTAASGTVTITLPAGALFIGAVPSFGNSETWELDIEDGVVVAGKAVAAS